MTTFDLMKSLSQADPQYVLKTDVFQKRAPTWRVIMKKTTKFALTAAAVVLVLGFIFGAWYLQTYYGAAPGSQGEKEPLRVVADLKIGGLTWEEGKLEEELSKVLTRARVSAGIEEIQLECLPKAGPERETALSRVRTEIMAGAGPDVFLCMCPEPNNGSLSDALFPYPEKAAVNGTFLPLDGYIENDAKFTHWDQLTPEVLAGGRTDQGQVILPLTYTFMCTTYDRALLGGKTYDEPLSWQEEAASEDPVYRAAADEGWRGGMVFGEMFPRLADYQTDRLAFTEEELLAVVEQAAALRQESQQVREEADILNFSSEKFGAPTHSCFRFGEPNENYMFSHSGLWNGVVANNRVAVDLRSDQEALILPLYNIDGGVTAQITGWAAVSAKTKRPGEAFAVLDMLASPSVITGSLVTRAFEGVPVYESAGKYPDFVSGIYGGEPVTIADGTRAGGNSGWILSDQSFAEYTRVRRQINAARFLTPLDEELSQTFLSCAYNKDTEAVRDKVNQCYQKLETLLGES